MNFCVLANKVTWAVREGREKKEKPTLALASSLADQSKLNYLNVFGACIFWYSFLSHYGTHLLFPEGTVSLFFFFFFPFHFLPFPLSLFIHRQSVRTQKEANQEDPNLFVSKKLLFFFFSFSFVRFFIFFSFCNFLLFFFFLIPPADLPPQWPPRRSRRR